MILFIECLIAIILFSLIVVPMTAKDPLGVISDYPPAIRKRCVELGLTKETKKRFETKDDYVKIGLNRKSLRESRFSRRSPISLTGKGATSFARRVS